MFISKQSNGFYYLYYFDKNGKRLKKSTNTKFKSVALHFLKSFEIQNKQLQNTEISLIEFFREYLKYSESHHTWKTTLAFRTTFNSMIKFLGNKRLIELTTSDIDRFLSNRIINTSIYAGRKDIINIKSVLNWAKERNYLLQNPADKIKRIKVPERQPMFFSFTDYQKLLDAVDNQQLKLIIVIALNTGMRQMEIISLRWSQVNLSEKILTLNNQNHITKGKRIRTIPLNSTCLEIFKLLEATKKCELVFHDNCKLIKQDYVIKVFKKYIQKAKLNDKLNFHSLRHTFASWLVQKGVSIYQVSKLLGHADIKTTQIYSHLRADDLQNTVNLLNNISQ